MPSHHVTRLISARLRALPSSNYHPILLRSSRGPLLRRTKTTTATSSSKPTPLPPSSTLPTNDEEADQILYLHLQDRHHLHAARDQLQQLDRLVQELAQQTAPLLASHLTAPTAESRLQTTKTKTTSASATAVVTPAPQAQYTVLPLKRAAEIPRHAADARAALARLDAHLRDMLLETDGRPLSSSTTTAVAAAAVEAAHDGSGPAWQQRAWLRERAAEVEGLSGAERRLKLRDWRYEEEAQVRRLEQRVRAFREHVREVMQLGGNGAASEGVLGRRRLFLEGVEEDGGEDVDVGMSREGEEEELGSRGRERGKSIRRHMSKSIGRAEGLTRTKRPSVAKDEAANQTQAPEAVSDGKNSSGTEQLSLHELQKRLLASMSGKSG